MAMQLVACVYFDITGDGTSTTAAIDLSTDAVSFAAGLNETFVPTGGAQVQRTLSPEFKVTSKNQPVSVTAIVTDDAGYTATGTVSGTVLNVTFSSALASGFILRCFSELRFEV